MWKKTFIRSTLLIMVALAGMLVFATTHTKKTPVSEDCTNSKNECCKKPQSDFIIWELSRSILTNAQF